MFTISPEIILDFVNIKPNHTKDLNMTYTNYMVVTVGY